MDSWILHIFAMQFFCLSLHNFFLYSIIRCNWIKKMPLKICVHSILFPRFRSSTRHSNSSVLNWKDRNFFFSPLLKKSLACSAWMNTDKMKPIMFRKSGKKWIGFYFQSRGKKHSSFHAKRSFESIQNIMVMSNQKINGLTEFHMSSTGYCLVYLQYAN